MKHPWNEEHWMANLRPDRSRRALWRVFWLIAHSGDFPVCLAAIALLAWLGGREGWALAATLTAGLGTSALLCLGLKYSLKRPRPAGSWGQDYRKRDPYSFPSGHALRTATLAVVVLLEGHPGWAAILGAWSLVISGVRVAGGLHYPSDILGGLAGGWLAGFLAWLIPLPL